MTHRTLKAPQKLLRDFALDPTHYGLGKHGWVTVTVRKRGKALDEHFKEWIEERFGAVAPKRLLANN
ncbi:MAG TPA: hypothetical protein VFT29_19260 [Gemmatimonadaceae bacterium]|nr:hypothetical protein [Gemmatimonadaceae bacterium]